MQIRKGLNTDLVRLECCDFSFTISHIAREPFIHCDLHIEAVAEPWTKTYELDIQTLENHCVNPDAIFLIAETDDGEIAGFIAVERTKRRTGAAQKLMAAAHVWARSVNAPGLRLETQNVNVSACLFYRHYGFTLGGYDRFLYNALPEKDEVALFWYYMLV
jgi:GNAT superfamily N-acetyltransferase